MTASVGIRALPRDGYIVEDRPLTCLHYKPNAGSPVFEIHFQLANDEYVLAPQVKLLGSNSHPDRLLPHDEAAALLRELASLLETEGVSVKR
jgi:hypothetical protein